MRRTSRLVLLLGIFLAALTFVVVLLIGRPATATGAATSASQRAHRSCPPSSPPLTSRSGTVVTAEMFTTQTLAVDLA